MTIKASWTVLGMVLALASVSSAVAFADAPKVEITSFEYINNTGRVAELCGKATGISAPALARVVVDVRTSNPAIYNVLVGKDGQFCTVVASYTGTADVTLEGLSVSAVVGRGR